jgi:general secretion pathway protein G
MRERRRERGFTLIEVLVVLAILTLIAGFAVPRVIGLFGKAQSDSARIQIELLSGALDHYRLDTGSYPSEEEGLQALMQRPAGVPQWGGPYLKGSQVPADPWGRPYRYRRPGDDGRPFDVISLGADGADGGDGENADIRNQ